MKSYKLWIYKLLTRFLPESRAFGLKAALLRFAGATVGRNVRIYSSASIVGNGQLEIGDDVHVGSRALIYPVAPVGIKIGSHTDIGPDVVILTGSHEIDPDGEHIAGKGIARAVEIGSGCWLGARSTILPGVVLNERTVIAAGAMVTKSTTSCKSLMAGVPARIVKTYG